MSQILDAVEETRAGSDARADVAERSPDAALGGFEYTPMPILAPVSAVLGVCSLIAYLGLFGIVLAGLGIIVGLAACWKIVRSGGTYSGKKLAMVGLLLSLSSAIGGSAVLAYNYKHEVPEGFERVSFANQISKNAFVAEDGVQDVSPEVKALADKPIFLKGFMYPTGQSAGITEFLLLKDSGQCCFGGQPALQDMIGVKMKDGLDVDYYAGRVSVAGTFKINPEYHGADSLEPLFQLETEHFDKSTTSF